MRQLKFEMWGEFVLSILDVPWEEDDPRGPGGQFEFHCNAIQGGKSFICRHYTYSGEVDEPHGIEQFSAAERAFDETFQMIKDVGHPGVPVREGKGCETSGF